MFFDAALVYDPRRRCCDISLGADGDLVTDTTPVTPMLLSIELDGRAAADDPLPQAESPFLTAAGIDARRGWAGDCLDPDYAPIGSKCWLMERAKQTEGNRLLYQMWLEQCLAWLERETGAAAQISVSYIRSGVLAWRATAANVTLGNTRGVA